METRAFCPSSRQKECLETHVFGGDSVIVATCEPEPKDCVFKWLCEEVHPEEEMEQQRKNCNDMNCRKCHHFWDFYEGYFNTDE